MTMNRVLLAFQFLTIIPIRTRGEVSAGELPAAASFFPVVGAFQGLLAVAVSAFCSALFSDEITGCLVLLILIAVNGGFHLDGLADTFDGLAVKSVGDIAHDRERRLAVMKDSATGAAGAVALILVILLKYLLIRDILLHSSSITRYALLFLLPVFSRWSMVLALSLGKPARKEGLGSVFIDAVGRKEVIISSLATLLPCLVVTGLLQYTRYAPIAAMLPVVLCAVLYIFCFLSVKYLSMKFGGLTGDCFGAVSEISEIVFLMVASLWLQRSIS